MRRFYALLIGLLVATTSIYLDALVVRPFLCPVDRAARSDLPPAIPPATAHVTILCPVDRAARSDGSSNGRPLSSVNGSVREDLLSRARVDSSKMRAKVWSLTHLPMRA